MIAAQVKKFRKELNSGTVALMVLAIVSRAEEPLYGYQIAKQLERNGPEKQGALYPVLRNMSAKGLLESYTQPSESGPPRRYFQITNLGKNVLDEWLDIWQQTQAFVNQVTGDHNNE